MTNTEAKLRTLVVVVLALLAMVGGLATPPPVMVFAPGDDVVSASWDCLLDLGYRGASSDGVEALYVSVADHRICGG